MSMYFITSTVKDWISLLAEKSFRNIIIESIRFLIEDKRILLHGYVIMPNHIHNIYTVNEPYQLSDILRDFHKFTSQQIIKIMRNQQDRRLSIFLSNHKDRRYQIWQSTHSPKTIVSYPFFKQKLEYIHYNPCAERWQLCNEPEEYPYSSAKDYMLDIPGILKVEKVHL